MSPLHRYRESPAGMGGWVSASSVETHQRAAACSCATLPWQARVKVRVRLHSGRSPITRDWGILPRYTQGAWLLLICGERR